MKSLKKHTIKLAAKTLNILRGQPIKSMYGGLGQILMFHRVTPKSKQPRLFANSYLEVTPEYLEWSIKYFKSHNYDFITIGSLKERLRRKKQTPFVIYTFDDGFKDNLHYAYPIFRKYNIPFTVYITTDFPDYKAILWWNHLESLIITHEHLHFDLNKTPYQFSTQTMKEKTDAFKVISSLIKHGTGEQLNSRLNQIFKPYNINPLDGIENKALSWDEIKILHADPLVTIGSHTASHPTLNQLSNEAAKYEIINAKKRLEKKLCTPIVHFAYPYGGAAEIGNRECHFVSEASISTAVTTYSSNIFHEHLSRLHTLPRIAVGSSMNKNTFDLIRFGVIPMIRNKGKRVVTL